MLEALVRRYESLLVKGKVPRRGWSTVKVSFGLEIDGEGNLLRVVDFRLAQARGKKEVLLPQELSVPAQLKRSSGIAPQFLCDNSSYFLGIDSKTDTSRSQKCFYSAAKLHQKILQDCQSPMATSVKAFFSKWNPLSARANSVLLPILNDLLAGGNIIFLSGTEYAQQDQDIQMAWDQQMQGGDDKVALMTCLVTGKTAPVARLHPSIKGVRGAQPSGASLVSFNAPAYESYGRDGEQGLNAPVSEYAAFAYGAALNQLLADQRHVKQIGDMTVVYWAEKNSAVCQDIFAGCLLGGTNRMEDAELDAIFRAVQGHARIDFRGLTLDYDNKFYVLGLSPNAARLSVRFFWESAFGDMITNLSRHQGRMQLVKFGSVIGENIPLWVLLLETVHQNSRDKMASPVMAGAMLRAILTDTSYPASVFQNMMLRIRAEQDDAEARPPHYKINYRRVALIKAYLIKNKGRQITVALDEDSKNPAYVFGRIFAVLEHIQQVANPGINSTIKDRYFDSACATPGKVFPLLEKLAHHHLRKLEIRQRIYFEKQLTGLFGKIDIGEHSAPAYLPLEKQGIFVLGYYHQTQKRYEKKEEK